MGGAGSNRYYPWTLNWRGSLYTTQKNGVFRQIDTYNINQTWYMLFSKQNQKIPFQIKKHTKIHINLITIHKLSIHFQENSTNNDQHRRKCRKNQINVKTTKCAYSEHRHPLLFNGTSARHNPTLTLSNFLLTDTKSSKIAAALTISRSSTIIFFKFFQHTPTNQHQPLALINKAHVTIQRKCPETPKN
jgi:hypothetical protein